MQHIDEMLALKQTYNYDYILYFKHPNGIAN